MHETVSFGGEQNLFEKVCLKCDREGYSRLKAVCSGEYPPVADEDPATHVMSVVGVRP